MDAGALAQWAATGVIGVTLIVSLVRNNRGQGEKWGSMETEIKNIKDKLDDPNSGLGAIKKAVDEQQTHCASVTSGFKERIKDLEERAKKE